jgi:SNF2 family DNA or RNA helicase
MAYCTCYHFINEQQNCKHIAALAYKYIDHLKTASQKIPFSGITTIIDTLPNDMGLGKTLQTLSFLASVQQAKPLETHLIVWPTSLIYKWGNELKKFTPHVRFHVYYGGNREWQEHDIDNADIMITSYGVVRSDIEQFTKHQFGYVILDESQAIKNPASQTAKAVELLKSRNRFILSGTPVQNNTFDLYGQFNFLNPGLLGNMEFLEPILPILLIRKTTAANQNSCVS